MNRRRSSGILGVLLVSVLLMGGWSGLFGAAPIEAAGQVQGRINFAVPGMPWPENFEMCSEIGFDWEYYQIVLGVFESDQEDMEEDFGDEVIPDPNPASHASTTSGGSFGREPNDPCRSAQFYLDMIDAPRAWAVQTGDQSVVVAVVDSGIDSAHPDLRDQLVPGFDLIGKSCEWDDPDLSDDDCTSHGTAVAGIIGAVGDNGIGITGVAWHVSLMPVRVAWLISVDEKALVEGIRLAADAGADVINMSVATTDDLPEIREAVADAIARGAVVVAAVGNTGGAPPGYPAAYEGVIGVGSLALAPEPMIHEFSAIGPGVDLVAPGEFILSTSYFGGYFRFPGTSMAAPIVSGVAALMIANGIPHKEVAEVLYRTAIWLGDPINNVADREMYGHGLVNAYGAVMGVDPKEAMLRVFTADGVPVGTTTSPNEKRQYVLEGVPKGEELYLLAWIDVDRDGFLNQGDYVALKRIAVDAGETLTVDVDLAVLDAPISLIVEGPHFDLDALMEVLMGEV